MTSLEDLKLPPPEDKHSAQYVTWIGQQLERVAILMGEENLLTEKRRTQMIFDLIHIEPGLLDGAFRACRQECYSFPSVARLLELVRKVKSQDLPGGA